MGEYASDDWPASPPMSALLDSVSHADLFDLCAAMPDASVDMILCDLPYGTTACAWDTIIPFEPMWKAFKRIIKPRGAIVLTASQPFTSALVMSNPKMFRYAWVWNKKFAGNFATAATIPMKTHEDICVFSSSRITYYPQMVNRSHAIKGGGMSRSKTIDNHSFIALHKTYTDKFPVTILDYPRDLGNTVHPTQKPVDLFRYLIRTYTQPGELVFDPCVGSGTTAIAAREEGRRFVCGDSSAEYVAVARNRLAQPFTMSFMPALEAAS